MGLRLSTGSASLTEEALLVKSARLNTQGNFEQSHPLTPAIRIRTLERLRRPLDLKTTLCALIDLHVVFRLLLYGNAGLGVHLPVIAQDDPAENVGDFHASPGSRVPSGIESLAGMNQRDVVRHSRIVASPLQPSG